MRENKMQQNKQGFDSKKKDKNKKKRPLNQKDFNFILTEVTKPLKKKQDKKEPGKT